MSLEDLERRIKVLEDIEEIRKLKYRYATYCDDLGNPDAIASLFTEDAVWEGLVGKAQGREEIRLSYIKTDQVRPFAIHLVMNPTIEVDGDTARGTWYLLEPCTFAEGNRAVWGAARYDEEYLRVNGEWKFQRLKLTSHFWTPFDEGWAKTRMHSP